MECIRDWPTHIGPDLGLGAPGDDAFGPGAPAAAHHQVRAHHRAEIRGSTPVPAAAGHSRRDWAARGVLNGGWSPARGELSPGPDPRAGRRLRLLPRVSQ